MDPGVPEWLPETDARCGRTKLAVGPGCAVIGGYSLVHNRAILPISGGWHGVKLLHEGKNWGNKSIESEYPTMDI